MSPTTFHQLRDEGMSPHAIETFMIARDAMGSWPADGLAEFLRASQRIWPVSPLDVFPQGRPPHWMTADEMAVYRARQATEMTESLSLQDILGGAA